MSRCEASSKSSSSEGSRLTAKPVWDVTGMERHHTCSHIQGSSARLSYMSFGNKIAVEGSLNILLKREMLGVVRTSKTYNPKKPVSSDPVMSWWKRHHGLQLNTYKDKYIFRTDPRNHRNSMLFSNYWRGYHSKYVAKWEQKFWHTTVLAHEPSI